MPDKKNTPSSHGESKGKETLDSLTIAAFKDLVNSVQSEIKPYLNTEGEMVLGNEVAVNRASLKRVSLSIKRMFLSPLLAKDGPSLVFRNVGFCFYCSLRVLSGLFTKGGFDPQTFSRYNN